jgi:hypothetical protein
MTSGQPANYTSLTNVTNCSFFQHPTGDPESAAFSSINILKFRTLFAATGAKVTRELGGGFNFVDGLLKKCYLSIIALNETKISAGGIPNGRRMCARGNC